MVKLDFISLQKEKKSNSSNSRFQTREFQKSTADRQGKYFFFFKLILTKSLNAATSYHHYSSHVFNELCSSSCVACLQVHTQCRMLQNTNIKSLFVELATCYIVLKSLTPLQFQSRKAANRVHKSDLVFRMTDSQVKPNMNSLSGQAEYEGKYFYDSKRVTSFAKTLKYVHENSVINK